MNKQTIYKISVGSLVITGIIGGAMNIFMAFGAKSFELQVSLVSTGIAFLSLSFASLSASSTDKDIDKIDKNLQKITKDIESLKSMLSGFEESNKLEKEELNERKPVTSQLGQPRNQFDSSRCNEKDITSQWSYLILTLIVLLSKRKK